MNECCPGSDTDAVVVMLLDDWVACLLADVEVRNW